MRFLSRSLAFGTLFAAVLYGTGLADQEVESVPLFNGKSLDGWERLGGSAEYQVEEGAIVGTTVKDSPNTFLCTEKAYGDFILEFEVKVDSGLNSGVQIRSHAYDQVTTRSIWRGGQELQVTHNAGEVYGCQVEIADGPQGHAGGVWDEARRETWLDDQAANPGFRSNDWNQYRIACMGDRIQTWVNETPCADGVDSEDLTGFIGLQVHSYAGDKPAKVRWRNIKIQDLGYHEWKPLFNGKDLQGWHPLPGGEWTVQEGAILGQSPASEPRHGLLMSDERFGDFTARVTFKAVQGNSGFYFRSDPVNDAVGVNGFQAEIDQAKDVGGLYETGGRAWVVQPSPADVATWFRPQDWNTLTVSAHSRHIVVRVNGLKSAELKDDPGRLEGVLALQLHGGMDMDVRFKAVEILMPAQHQ